jgi:hypothetical protein
MRHKMGRARGSSQQLYLLKPKQKCRPFRLKNSETDLFGGSYKKGHIGNRARKNHPPFNRKGLFLTMPMVAMFKLVIGLAASRP